MNFVFIFQISIFAFQLIFLQIFHIGSSSIVNSGATQSATNCHHIIAFPECNRSVLVSANSVSKSSCLSVNCNSLFPGQYAYLFFIVITF